ncbi:MAG TPA: alternative ribosome rescue aminoacyl-tRNA hydrolase ArfB [Vicinamibacterales bacterium]|nr:alternative ribosome rescue aminoacyl-tRNA hydrolase ArfB [Vicinamibacterales bacterium]
MSGRRWLAEVAPQGAKQMRITNDLVVDDHEIKERFVRSMGADGQNPRRKATAVELRFDIGRSSLPADVRARLIGLGGRHVTADDVLVVVSRRYRSQVRNREAARKQLLQLLREASEPIAERVS